MTAVCRICGNVLISPWLQNIVHEQDRFAVYVCDSCNIGFTDPFPPYDTLDQLYSSGSYRLPDGSRFHGFVEILIRLFSFDKKRRINKLIKRGALLDVGCGRGLFLDIMKQDGWSVTGVEFNEKTASTVANTYAVPVVPSHAMHNLPEDSFDVITIFHVLEHVENPVRLLAICRRLLKHNGLLVITTPNLSSIQASFGKDKWFHLDIPYHLHHFSLEGLRALLAGYPFEIVQVRHFDFEQNVFGWIQTLLNMSGIEHNVLFHLLKRSELKKGKNTLTRLPDVIMTMVLLPLYVPLSLLLSIVEALVLRKGSTISFFALKR